MAHFMLVHGSYHGAWCWDFLRPELERLGHGTATVDLPISDPGLGAAEYAATVAGAIPKGWRPVLVGHSMSGLVIPLVPALRRVRRLVFLAGLLPAPGRSANDQRDTEPVDGRMTPRTSEWTPLGDDVWMVGPNTASEVFFHDAKPALAKWATERLRAQSYRVMSEVTPLEAWPEVVSAYITCRADRAVNPAWGREVARARLGVEAHEIEGGHSPFLTRPAELAALLHTLA